MKHPLLEPDSLASACSLLLDPPYYQLLWALGSYFYLIVRWSIFFGVFCQHLQLGMSKTDCMVSLLFKTSFYHSLPYHVITTVSSFPLLVMTLAGCSHALHPASFWYIFMVTS